jgi:hypothetical protein
MTEDKDKARFFSVSNEDAEYTKHWIRQFVLAKKLRVPPQMPAQDMEKMRNIWQGRNYDDIKEAEYRQLWNEVEKEMQDDR